MRVTVDLNGFARLQAAMEAAGPELSSAIFRATEQATTVTADAIRAATPEHTGRLARSVTTVVTRVSDGVQGRISSSLRYARFVEYGTHKHGRAQRMFMRGVSAEEPQIQEIYRQAVDEVVASLK